MTATNVPALSFISPDTDPGEWREAWAGLASRCGTGTAAECPTCGEVWQYMGTALLSFYEVHGWAQDNGQQTEFAHQFRHRCRFGAFRRDPAECGRRVYVNVIASRTWRPRKEVAPH